MVLQICLQNQSNPPSEVFEGGYRFIIALPMSLKYCQKLMEEHGLEIVNHSEYLLTFSVGLVYNFVRSVHLFSDFISKTAAASIGCSRFFVLMVGLFLPRNFHYYVKRKVMV